MTHSPAPRRVRVGRATAVLAAMLLVAACGSDDAASTGDTASTSEVSSATVVTTDAAPVTSEAAPDTTEAASEAADAPVSFELPTAEMSAEDAAALPDSTLLVAVDPANLEEGQTPGFLYGVWDPEQGVHLAAAGLSEIDSATPMATDMSFRIGSITKTFTATAVLLLVDDGKVDLDEPVATYTGDLTAALPGGDTVTVRQLLGMKSGWPEYSNDPEGPFTQQLQDPSRQFTAEDLVAAAAGEEPTSTDEVAYVNTNYIVLGRLVENASGTSYSEFVKERILDEVGLENTVIPDQIDTASTVTHGYLNAGWADFDGELSEEVLSAGSSGDDITEMSTSVGGTAGNGVSTLADLATWAAADFGSALLSESSREARLTASPADNIIPGSGYALGLQVIGDWHFHGGEILGWESQAFANPTTGQVIVVNSNACCGLVATNLYAVASTFPDDPDLASILALLGG